MSLESKVRASIIAGIITMALNLLVQWIFNGALVKADAIISLVSGVLVALIIAILLRHRGKIQD